MFCLLLATGNQIIRSDKTWEIPSGMVNVLRIKVYDFAFGLPFWCLGP